MNKLIQKITRFKPYMNEDAPPAFFILVHILILSIFFAVLFLCK